MTVFLTPDQRPFFAGTYFPPRDGFGRPGFSTLLTQIADLWERRRPDLVEQAETLTAHLRERAVSAPGGNVGEAEIRAAVRELAAGFDPTYGGFGPAPKFPPAAQISSSPPTPPADRRRCRPGHGDQDPGWHGPGRDVRPDRRRLCPLLHGRALAGPPLRKDAVRQRPAREDLSGGLPGLGGRLLCPDRPRDSGVHPAGDGRPRGRVLFGNRRRLGGRGGQVLRLDAGRGGGGPGPRRGRPALRLFRHHRRRQLGGQEYSAHAALGRAGRLRASGSPWRLSGRAWRTAGPGCTRPADSGFRPGWTTRSSRPGTG